MNFLEPDSDRAVRASVDAFIEKRLRPAIAGDMIFETKNSRYRMHNGKITAATNARLEGWELVGWLVESPETSHVLPRWSAGARAVLLDRRFGRNLIVTSPTLMLEVNGKLVEGSDTRPLPGTKASTPAMMAVNPSTPAMPAIPKPAGVPPWAQTPIAETGEALMPPSVPPASVAPPSVPITPSTPPPRGSAPSLASPPPPKPSTPPPRPSAPGSAPGSAPLNPPPRPPGRTPAG